MLRYYCHHCHNHMNADELLPDFTCPSCQSGFVEELSAHASSSSRRNSGADDPNRASSDDSHSGFNPARMDSDEFSDDNSDVEFLDSNGPLAQVFSLFQPQQQSTTTTTTTTTAPASNTAGQSSQQESDASNTIGGNTIAPRMLARRTPGRSTAPGQMHSTAYIDSTANQSLADVLNDFITGVSFGTHYPDGTPSSNQGVQGAASGSGSVPSTRGLINIDFPIPFFLHSNPGDYAWGNAGFDAVITQLLNNLDGSNSGPPPMPKEQVDNLPTVKISDDQVKGRNLQCAVCMDDFQVGDGARQLPCEHFFHQDCILPWLDLHASCPICRETFNGNNSAHNQGSGTSTEPTSHAIINSAPNLSNTTPNVVGSTNRNAASSTPTTTLTNQNVAPNYDYTEDDCD